jgi:hypothetical protein
MRFPLLSSFLLMLWFFLWIIWIVLLVRIIADIFRSTDLGGWAKAGWLLFILVLPFAGVLIYLIARGSSMQERRMAEARYHDEEVRAYIRDAAGAAGADGTANQLAKLADLREKGVINEAEFQLGNARILV